MPEQLGQDLAIGIAEIDRQGPAQELAAQVNKRMHQWIPIHVAGTDRPMGQFLLSRIR